MAETPYVEANALLAAQSGDDDELYTLVNGMTPGEVVELYRATTKLGNALWEYMQSTHEDVLTDAGAEPGEVRTHGRRHRKAG